MEYETYSKEELETAHAILGYLYKNPDARDTLRGIAEWWLLKERIDRGVTEIKRALSCLLPQEFVVEKKIDGGQECYQINKTRLKEISEIIEVLEKESIF